MGRFITMIEYISLYDLTNKYNKLWYPMPLYLIARKEVDFEHRAYRINGVVYTKHTHEFEEEFVKCQTWLAISNPEPTMLDIMYNFDDFTKGVVDED